MSGYAGLRENGSGRAQTGASSEEPGKHDSAARIPAVLGEDNSRRGLVAAIAAVVVTTAVAVSRPASAVDPDGAFRRSGDLVIYLAVIPAAVVRGHPPEHTGRGLHGGPPPGRYVHHLLVALFDARTGTRVADADVKAVVHGLRHAPEERIELEPMVVGGAQAYGGFATLPARDYYRIEIEVNRTGGTAPVRAVFPHRHFQP
ncbi:hypothetical protein [Roseomonas chloroacetimidivorans]|uniref:hypothetical protein n=1 Tax=Roseomonas chloroacetimidivorans TaxID=1766656 RepID=UPI003C70D033